MIAFTTLPALLAVSVDTPLLKAEEVIARLDPPSPFVMDLDRLGYYGGQGGRHLARLGPFRGTFQPEATIGAERLRACSG
jgi:hypothetical protein